MARAYNVTERTIRRDAQFAEALDTLSELFGVEFRSDVLAGATGLSKKDIITLAQMRANTWMRQSHDWASLHELAEMCASENRDLHRPPPPLKKTSLRLFPRTLRCRDALVNILWVCDRKRKPWTACAASWNRLRDCARGVGQQVESIGTAAGTGAPLVTDEDLL
jgi:hypothetical protein